MGYYLGYALSLYGREQDRLSHRRTGHQGRECPSTVPPVITAVSRPRRGNARLPVPHHGVASLNIDPKQTYSLSMSKQDRIKWNQRYAEDSYRKNNPVTLVENWIARIPAGRALDVACGAGRNALFLAQAGYQVDAIDISPEGLNQARQKAEDQGLSINWIEQDLDQAYPFDTDYDLILVMWYVDLALITRLCDCLAPGGYLLCEEHLITDQEVIGPTSSSYRVAPGELREAVSGLEVLWYEESIEMTSEGEQVASARVVAKNN